MSGIQFQSLGVTFRLPQGDVRAVDGVSAEIPAGQITGLVGESGCGKSVLGLALLGLLPPYAQLEGRIYLDGVPVTPAEARRRLGREIGLIPQTPSESLNPARRVRAHLYEALAPLALDRRARRARAEELLRSFGFDDPARILRAYPHELSGGMQQRVLCAIGAACRPGWMLADEPTKGLDPSLHGQVQETLASLSGRGTSSMLLITHDLPLARALCTTLAVMYAGQIVEFGPRVLECPCHPYTRAFLRALPENGFQSLPGTAIRAGEGQAGCPFAPRCPAVQDRCRRERPPETSPEPGRKVRCFRYV